MNDEKELYLHIVNGLSPEQAIEFHGLVAKKIAELKNDPELQKHPELVLHIGNLVMQFMSSSAPMQETWQSKLYRAVIRFLQFIGF